MERTAPIRTNVVSLVALVAIAVWIFAASNARTSSTQYNVTEVDLSQARALIAAGALIVDVRGKKQFDSRHIAGAILLPIAVLRAGIPLSFDIPKSESVVVYCNNARTHGQEATHILQQAGYTNVVVLEPGIEGWADADLPIEKG